MMNLVCFVLVVAAMTNTATNLVPASARRWIPKIEAGLVVPIRFYHQENLVTLRGIWAGLVFVRVEVIPNIAVVLGGWQYPSASSRLCRPHQASLPNERVNEW
eukprot:scaffold16017_cov183-Amphora_coffeaeformis.AAC.6